MGREITTINPQPWMQIPDSAKVMEVLEADKGNARFVGGCVRDALRFKPIRDIDIATIHSPDKVRELCERAGLRVVPTGISHGTVTVLSGKLSFEVTTLRKDVACDGRHAKVEFTDDWEEDASRRDFTMNAISLAPDGALYDYFGGKEDIKDGVVRFVGDPSKRIEEDYLRILRLFRFHALCGKKPIADDILAACREGARGLAQISGERIQKEMFSLFLTADPVYALHTMQDVGMLQYLFPYTSHDVPLGNIPAIMTIEKEVAAEVSIPLDPFIRFVGIMPVVSSSNNNEKESFLRKLHDRWKFSKKDRDHLWRLLCPAHYITSDITTDIQHKTVMRMGKERFISSVFIYLAIEMLNYPEREEKIIESGKRMIKENYEWEMPVFPVSGRDLIAMGLPEGADIGKLLNKAEIYWEEKGYRADREDILDFIKAKS